MKKSFKLILAAVLMLVAVSATAKKEKYEAKDLIGEWSSSVTQTQVDYELQSTESWNFQEDGKYTRSYLGYMTALKDGETKSYGIGMEVEGTYKLLFGKKIVLIPNPFKFKVTLDETDQMPTILKIAAKALSITMKASLVATAEGIRILSLTDKSMTLRENAQDEDGDSYPIDTTYEKK